MAPSSFIGGDDAMLEKGPRRRDAVVRRGRRALGRGGGWARLKSSPRPRLLRLLQLCFFSFFVIGVCALQQRLRRGASAPPAAAAAAQCRSSSVAVGAWRRPAHLVVRCAGGRCDSAEVRGGGAGSALGRNETQPASRLCLSVCARLHVCRRALSLS